MTGILLLAYNSYTANDIYLIYFVLAAAVHYFLAGGFLAPLAPGFLAPGFLAPVLPLPASAGLAATTTPLLPGDLQEIA